MALGAARVAPEPEEVRLKDAPVLHPLSMCTFIFECNTDFWHIGQSTHSAAVTMVVRRVHKLECWREMTRNVKYDELEERSGSETSWVSFFDLEVDADCSRLVSEDGPQILPFSELSLRFFDGRVSVGRSFVRLAASRASSRS